VSALKEAHPDKGQDAFRDVCGLPINTYFAGVKMKWTGCSKIWRR
jgi:glycerol kinase